MEALEIVKKLIKEGFDFTGADVTEESLLVDDLNFDSLDIVEFIIALEEEFGFEISDEDFADVKTVGDVVEHVTKKQGE